MYYIIKKIFTIIASPLKFLPLKKPLEIIITSGASCPDSLVEKTIVQILSYYSNVNSFENILRKIN
jgi:4-hydroxy-3-methylbut-2-enyl diphosphate reductase